MSRYSSNPAPQIVNKIDAYLKSLECKSEKKTSSGKSGLLRSTKSMKNKNDNKEKSPLARVAQYVKTIREIGDESNGSA